VPDQIPAVFLENDPVATLRDLVIRIYGPEIVDQEGFSGS